MICVEILLSNNIIDNRCQSDFQLNKRTNRIKSKEVGDKKEVIN